jgi:predicted DNA-binding transcriptional regulator AlpA
MATTGEVEPQGEGSWLTLREAAQRLALAEKSVYRRAQRGQLPSRKDASGRVIVWIAQRGTTFPSGGQWGTPVP